MGARKVHRILRRIDARVQPRVTVAVSRIVQQENIVHALFFAQGNAEVCIKALDSAPKGKHKRKVSKVC